MLDRILDFFRRKRLQNTIFTIALVCAWGGVFYSFVTVPYTGDIQVFMAGENQVKYQNSTGLMALFEAWDMKGIVNRLIIYTVYRITLLFVEYGSIYQFMVVSKAIYGFFAVAIIMISSLLLPEENNKKIQFGIVSYFAVFATFTASHMQAEMSTVLLSLLVYSLLLKESKSRAILAGIFGSLFFFTKSILLLLFFSVLACVYLSKKKSDISNTLTTIVSFAISELVLFVGMYFVYPKDIIEMKNAAEFQSTALSTGSNIPLLTIIGNFVNQYVQSWVAIPFLALGMFCSIILLSDYIRDRDIAKTIALTVAWIMPIDIIVISNCYFIYHYFLLVLPCIVTVFLYLKRQGEINIYGYMLAGVLALAGVVVCWILKDGIKQVSFLNYSTVLLVLIHLAVFSVFICAKSSGTKLCAIFEVLALTVSIFFYANYSSFISPKSRNMIFMTKASAEMMSHFPEDFDDEPVLLLDSGTVTFYNDAKSYSEYFYNLPLQRWSEGKEWEVQKSEYEKIMAYDGKYIVYTSWFGVDKYPEFKEKLDTEYVRLEKSGYYAYSANWDVFQLDTPPDANAVLDSEGRCIYIRKDR